MLEVYLLAGVLPPVSAPSCWLSNSTSCCSLSISMMRGTTSTKKVVADIHRALKAQVIVSRESDLEISKRASQLRQKFGLVLTIGYK